jgi:hypothetical protein
MARVSTHLILIGQADSQAHLAVLTLTDLTKSDLLAGWTEKQFPHVMLSPFTAVRRGILTSCSVKSSCEIKLPTRQLSMGKLSVRCFVTICSATDWGDFASETKLSHRLSETITTSIILISRNTNKMQMQDATRCWYFYWVIYDARIYDYQINYNKCYKEHLIIPQLRVTFSGFELKYSLQYYK